MYVHHPPKYDTYGFYERGGSPLIIQDHSDSQATVMIGNWKPRLGADRWDVT